MPFCFKSRLVLIAYLITLPLYANAVGTSKTTLNHPVGIQLRSGRQAQTMQLSTRSWHGHSWVVLKTAIDYLDGSTSWHSVTKKIILKGPTGRQAVLTADMSRLVVERRQLVRLPHLPRIRHGNIWVSPETLEVIWQHIGARQAKYNAANKTFFVGDMPVQRAPDQPQAKKIKKASGKKNIAKPNDKRSIIVVVDAGHGGKDPGAIGPTKLKEKTVTLEIAKQLAYYLKKQGVEVVMTRSRDRYISLKERANKANRIKADLFVSIHANASRNRKANGSQVFIYNREASSRHAAESAKLENQDANYLEIIKDDLRQSVHEVSSVNAAGFISQQFSGLGLVVKRIERAPFYVLAKSHMPSILVETAFISNYKEEKKLRSKIFCQKLAKGIYRGINNYHKETKQKK